MISREVSSQYYIHVYAHPRVQFRLRSLVTDRKTRFDNPIESGEGRKAHKVVKNGGRRISKGLETFTRSNDSVPLSFVSNEGHVH